MKQPIDALRAGLAPRPVVPATRRRHAVVVGGAGPLGGAVLEQALGAGAFAHVSALVVQPVDVALRGLDAVCVPPQLDQPPTFGDRPDTAIVVFDRERSFHGREAAFLRPEAARLPDLARWLQEAGVRWLLIVLPHAPALLPQALKAGLASMDEQAVASLGFEQLVFVRPARQGGDGPGAVGGLHRVARALLAQLHWMVPQREQPLRPARVAQFVIELARALPSARPGTRVAPPELLWDWAQPDGGEPVLEAWLAGLARESTALPRTRW